jgi:hypothetical protein
LRISRKTFYLQFYIETPEGHQKVNLAPEKFKKNKNSYGFHPTELAGITQVHKKKWSEHQINQSKQKSY